MHLSHSRYSVNDYDFYHHCITLLFYLKSYPEEITNQERKGVCTRMFVIELLVIAND